MLKIWMNESNCENVSVVTSPDLWYDDYQSDDILDLELAHEIIMNTSAITEIRGTNSFVTRFGSKISDDKLSEGCKCLLMMLNKECGDDNLAYCLNFMGRNCESYMERIAVTSDINIVLTRPYVPTSEDCYKAGIKFMDSGKVVYNERDYLIEYLRY